MAPLIFGSIAFLHNYTDSTQIAITHKGTNGKGFITTVNDKEDSARCHVNLFNHINKRILVQNGKWE